MDSGHASERDPIADFDVSGEGSIVSEDAAIANDAIVGDVDVCHEQAIFANFGFPAVGCAFVECAALADDGSAADEKFGEFAPIFEVLRDAGDDCAGVDFHIIANPCAVADGYVISDPAIVTDLHVLLNVGERQNGAVVPDFGVRMDDPHTHIGHSILNGGLSGVSSWEV